MASAQPKQGTHNVLSCVVRCDVLYRVVWCCLWSVDCGVMWCGVVWCGVLWCAVV